jgi:hypothetical protein
LEGCAANDGFSSHDPRAHGKEGVAQRLQPTSPTLRVAHGGRDRHDLAFEFAGADHPVDAILEHAGQAEAVLGRGDEESVALANRAPPGVNGRRRGACFDIGVEWR